MPVTAAGFRIDRRKEGDHTERHRNHRTELFDEHRSFSTGYILMITTSPTR